MYTTQPHTLSTMTSELALVGNSGYQMQDNRVIINIEKLVSQRDLGDISGTLSIELWALKQPYQGGDFSGTVLAGTQIGELLGQHYLADCRYDLIYQEPPAGSWYLSLMLREWTEAGFVTRDYINFTLPYIASSKPSVVRSETDNVINVSFAGNEKSAVRTVAELPAAPVKSEAAPKPVKPQAPRAEAAKTAPASAPTAAAEATGSNNRKQQIQKAVEAASKKVTSEATVSLNKASRKEIAAIKGISKKLAENIVSARPFKSLDDLLTVKGMGPNLLQKVRDFIKL